jgi:hypothetical protein
VQVQPQERLRDMKKGWKGGMVAEGLSDPTVINNFSVYKASISEDNMPIDYEENVGRWHGYGVRCLERKSTLCSLISYEAGMPISGKMTR